MESKIKFYGNLYVCPAGKRNPECPIGPYNNLTFAEKVDWFDGLSPEERALIEEHHTNCVGKR